MNRPTSALPRWAAALCTCFLGLAPAVAGAQDRPVPDHNAVIFVHGGSGSAAQFQSQALRFASNGYAMEEIRAFEFDSSRTAQIMPEILAGIDALVAELQRQTGRAQVDLVGHSLGTAVSQAFLSTPQRAANIGHYVNADGRTANALPGGVPTTALFAGAARAVQGRIAGATNVTLDDQLHVEAVSSASAFREMFRLFTGVEPATSDIVPATTPTVAIAGRATFFPQNTGVDGATLEIYALDPATGLRRTDDAGAELLLMRVAIDATGDFGPIGVPRGAPLELALLRPGALPHSFFVEPPLRDDGFLRLGTTNLSDAELAARSDANSAFTLVRNKEFRGDLSPDLDRLEVDGQNIINAATTPCCAVGLAPVALTVNDAGLDRTSNLMASPGQVRGFVGAADLFVAADAARSITIRLVPRGDAAAARTLRIPARPSSRSRMNVLFDEAR
jgi:pimeloyl-ACP methyl ester carboxylesterase